MASVEDAGSTVEQFGPHMIDVECKRLDSVAPSKESVVKATSHTAIIRYDFN